MNNYKLGSLFDGSGGFPLAGALCGVEPVWASEVEPYPIAVTRSRFPNMKHLGDISKIDGAEIEPVDIITFGSPCQDLSTAGLRKGLKHINNGDEETTRSGLFMEAVRIIKEMRKATNGEYPRFALWENVPGAFSSNKGEDFRVVCEELIKIVEPSAFMPPVPKNGWNYADSYVGDGWSLAYRVFDAQYWGVPQRRRRIHLVADFRGGSAREVLFEREGLRGYFAEGRTPWQGTAADAPGSLGANDREGKAAGGRQLDVLGLVVYNQMLTGNKAKTLTNKRTDSDHVPCVLEPLPLNTLSISHGSGGDLRRGDGIGAPGEPQFSISCSHPHAVAYRQGGFADYIEGEIGTLRAQGGDLGGGSENLIVSRPFYIVRRLTPTECARLQGFADWWAYIEPKDKLTEAEYRFWLEVRNTHARINGKKEQDYTERRMLTWYNKLYTESNEYKMWGNGIALPPALYCMQGITDALDAEEDAWMQ
jgi:DNA (cytosine-5)-methyltransferase 1